MRKYFTIVLLIFCFASSAQTRKFHQFKIVVIKPDTAIIDRSLYSDIDSIEWTQRNRFIKLEAQFDSILHCKTRDTLFNSPMKVGLSNMKAYDLEMKNFKYYQLISFNSVFYYTSYFNDNEASLYDTVIESPNQNATTEALRQLANNTNADYVIFFSNIHTEVNDKENILKLTTSLYSHKENKILLTKETAGKIKPFGSSWEWPCNNKLSMLLINGVKSSTNEIVPEILKREVKQ
jgi:hypothetical protein